jgi:hypothetical protein
VEDVRIALAVAPRLLSDVLTRLLTAPGLTWSGPEDAPPEISLATTDQLDQAHGRIVIVLPDRAEDPVQLLVDGHVIPGPRTPPDQLRTLILELAHGISPETVTQNHQSDESHPEAGQHR